MFSKNFFFIRRSDGFVYFVPPSVRKFLSSFLHSLWTGQKSFRARLSMCVFKWRWSGFFSRLLRTFKQCKWMFISVDLNKWHPSDILNALMAAHTSSGDLLGVVKSEPRAKGWQMRSQAGSEAKCREAERKSWKFTSSVSIRAILMSFYD